MSYIFRRTLCMYVCHECSYCCCAYLDNPLAVDEQIAGLDVPVDAFLLLQVGQRQKHLVGYARQRDLGNSADLAVRLFEVSTGGRREVGVGSQDGEGKRKQEEEARRLLLLFGLTRFAMMHSEPACMRCRTTDLPSVQNTINGLRRTIRKIYT